MSFYEDLARIKVDAVVKNGLKAQQNQRVMHPETDLNPRFPLRNAHKWLALLIMLLKGG